jgi:hypothetical protein
MLCRTILLVRSSHGLINMLGQENEVESTGGGKNTYACDDVSICPYRPPTKKQSIEKWDNSSLK